MNNYIQIIVLMSLFNLKDFLYKNSLFLAVWLLINLVHSSVIAAIASKIYRHPFTSLLPIAYIAGVIISFFSAGSGYFAGRSLFRFLINKKYLRITKLALQYSIVIAVSILGALAGLFFSAWFLKLIISSNFWKDLHSMFLFWVIATIISAVIISTVTVSIDILILNNKNYISQIQQLNMSTDEFLTFREMGTIRRVKYDDILYLSSSGKKSILHTEKENCDISFTLKKTTAYLPRNLFLRVHRQYVVNIKKIKSLNHFQGGSYFVILKDDDDSPIPVGRSYMSHIRKHLQKESFSTAESH